VNDFIDHGLKNSRNIENNGVRSEFFKDSDRLGMDEMNGCPAVQNADWVTNN
jgi:hypothetical protein